MNQHDALPNDALPSSHGYFLDGGREFAVTEPNTPRGWMNYAWNPRFISAVNQHGGGDGAYKERAIQYIDPRGRALVVRDAQRCFYLRDRGSGVLWSPGWHPVQRTLDQYRCRHGLGYSVIESEAEGVQAAMRWFVPADHPCEVWTITLTNRRDNAASLQWFTFVDLLLGGYPVYCDYYSSLSGEYDEATGLITAINLNPDRTHEWFNAYLGSDRKPDGFDTSRRRFLGNFGHVGRPEAVLDGGCRGSLAANEKMVLAAEHRLDLPPGRSVQFNLFIGACSGFDSAREDLLALARPGAVDAAFDELRQRKQAMVERLTIQTPDPKVDALVNGWLKQQVQIYADVGSDNGRGFRDAMQLLWATASFDLDYTKRMLEECLRHQYADGHTLRGWLPVDDHHYSDGPVWIAPVVDAYLKESGDPSILDMVVPYFDEGEATVWEHTLRGLRHASDDLGPRGLIRCHFGDWNDSLTGIDLEGRGESVWTTIGIVYGLKVAAELADKVLADSGVRDEMLQRAERLTGAVREHGWDGRWFLRAINDHGERIGSHTDDEGAIWLLPQVWAVLAGIVDDKQAAALFEEVDRRLWTPYGFKTLHPPYTAPRKHVGRITSMAPGMWENGTPYCHATGFKILADCAAGRGDEAYQTYRRVMPDNADNPSTHSGCEPYAFTNQYIGPENRRAGETQFAWMTGAGGWFYRAMTEGILGVRADHDGLRVDPCLPRAWGECTVARDFRGARYRITIRNPDRLERGRVRLTVDGQPREGNVAPIFADGREHTVEAELRPNP